MCVVKIWQVSGGHYRWVLALKANRRSCLSPYCLVMCCKLQGVNVVTGTVDVTVIIVCIIHAVVCWHCFWCRATSYMVSIFLFLNRPTPCTSLEQGVKPIFGGHTMPWAQFIWTVEPPRSIIWEFYGLLILLMDFRAVLWSSALAQFLA